MDYAPVGYGALFAYVDRVPWIGMYDCTVLDASPSPHMYGLDVPPEHCPWPDVDPLFNDHISDYQRCFIYIVTGVHLCLSSTELFQHGPHLYTKSNDLLWIGLDLNPSHPLISKPT